MLARDAWRWTCHFRNIVDGAIFCVDATHAANAYASTSCTACAVGVNVLIALVAASGVCSAVLA